MDFSPTIAQQTRSVRDVVYEKLKEAIVMERYKPGDRLNERELARQFRISTTPLKEALRLLEQEGLVVTKPRVGSYVSNDIMTSIEEINLVRAALEGVAVRLATAKINDAEIEALRQALQEMERYTKEKDPEKLVGANDYFHKLIRSFAKNNYVSKQIEAIRSFDLSFRRRALAHVDEFDRALADHRQIYLQIAARDPDAAEKAMRLHIHRTTMFVMHGNKTPLTEPDR
ncbi:MAG: GntR family transcriptional regulator [Negativicutes bacterium]|nr:GntR family transcriptional regulator [Negativicutes bacterium]